MFSPFNPFPAESVLMRMRLREAGVIDHTSWHHGLHRITDLYHGNDPVTESGNVPTCRSCDNICEMTTATISRLNILWTTALLQSKYFCPGLGARSRPALHLLPRLPIVGISGGMIRSWNLYQLFSGLWTPIKTKEDSPVFSQSVIINFGHNYSVIFVTRGCGWDDSAVARRWPETSWSRGYFLHNPGLGHRHWGWWNFLKKDREIKNTSVPRSRAATRHVYLLWIMRGERWEPYLKRDSYLHSGLSDLF